MLPMPLFKASSRPFSKRWTVLASLGCAALFAYAIWLWQAHAGFREVCNQAIDAQRQLIEHNTQQAEQARLAEEKRDRLRKLEQQDRVNNQSQLAWAAVIAEIPPPVLQPQPAPNQFINTRTISFRPTSSPGIRPTIAHEDQFWSFRPLTRPRPPAVKQTTWPRNPIDAFILARLNRESLRPNTAPSRHILQRRLHFGLIGLPPTSAASAESGALATNAVSNDEYERNVDQLLADPRFGERWARIWLDLARYADSNGYEEDEMRPHAFPYRDFVIWAMNHDLPFDNFVRWQIAGDLLAPDNPLAVAATGFLTAGPYNTFFPQEAERFDELDDIVSTLGSSMLGLSIGCARCHDHKYDEISAREYYGLVAVFYPTQRGHSYLVPDQGREYLRWAEPVHQRRNEIKEIRIARIKEDNIQELDHFTTAEKDLLRQPVDPDNKQQARLISLCERCLLITDEQISDDIEPLPADLDRFDRLQREIAEIEKTLPERPPLGLTIQDGGAATVPFLEGGDVRRRRKNVGPGFLGLVTPDHSSWDQHDWRNWDYAAATDRPANPRVALANWITDLDNGPGPLLARVIVNRLWQHHFGQGLVRTPNDFGAQGDQPSHPELLEWLACELVDSGWSLKHIHRLIVMSATYRQSTQANPRKQLIDPDNRLVSRRQSQRITAEMLWDSLLNAGGCLTNSMYGPGIMPPITRDAVFNTQKAPEETWPIDTDFDRPTLWRRGIYIMHKRTIPVPLLQLFDSPVASFSCGERQVTTVPTQALAIWHSDFVRRQAKRTADRILAEVPQTENQAEWLARIVVHVYHITLGRAPDVDETRLAIAFLQQSGANPGKPRRHQDLTNLCQVMFLSNEFLYID